MAWQYAAFAAFKLIQGLQQGEMIRQQGELSKRIGEINAAFAEQDAAEAVRLGLTQAAQYETTIKGALATQSAQLAAADVDASFGTAAEIRQETELVGFLNKVEINNKAGATALGLKRQALNYQTQGNLAQSDAELKASSAQGAAIMDAAGTMMMGYKGGMDKPDAGSVLESSEGASGLYQSPVNYKW